ncbi:hypothetical protein HGRIS_006322 [Hohenbuehelia grisea]|uniref:Uncharacterized protein n=1 Tax=Hohenbuehelia grisea TaxID=104357 RepID=A0ABR3JZY9_9AGAR
MQSYHKLILLVTAALSLALPALAAPVPESELTDIPLPGWNMIHHHRPKTSTTAAAQETKYLPGWNMIRRPITHTAHPSVPTKRAESDAPGIPGWKPEYGVGPVVPQPTKVQSKSAECTGIPGWKPWWGLGPVAPCSFQKEEETAGIPGWKPEYGVGPVIPPTKPTGDATKCTGIPGWKPEYGVGPMIPCPTNN